MLKKGALILLFLFNLYMLLKIILFKFSEVSATTLIDQAMRVHARPEIIASRITWANFVPFETISKSFYLQLTGNEFLNIYGNIIIFIPTGILLALMTRRKWLTSLLVSFSISLMLESMQLFLAMGSFDVDDIILNTSGGLIGTGIFVIVKAATRLWFRSIKVQEAS